MLEGQVIVGFSVSLTVTVNEHDAVLPDASVTVKVFVVVPVGNVLPLACPAVCAVVAPAQLSVPVGVVYVTTAPHVPASLLCVMLEGQVIVGFSVSFTVTVKLHDAVLLDASVTVKVFVVVPAGNVLCLLYTSPSPRDGLLSRMPSSA